MGVRIEAHRQYGTQTIYLYQHFIDMAAFSCECRITLPNADIQSQANCLTYEFFVLGGIFSYTVVLYAIIIRNNRNIN